MRKVAIAVSLSACVATTGAQAHVTIWPRESTAGGFEKYTVRAPTEGKIATTEVELGVADGATIVAIGVPLAWKYETRREGDRIVSVVWKMNIAPGEFAEFSFMARNPATPGKAIWRLRQRFADGTASDFTEGPKGIYASATVSLTSSKP